MRVLMMLVTVVELQTIIHGRRQLLANVEAGRARSLPSIRPAMGRVPSLGDAILSLSSRV